MAAGVHALGIFGTVSAGCGSMTCCKALVNIVAVDGEAEGGDRAFSACVDDCDDACVTLCHGHIFLVGALLDGAGPPELLGLLPTLALPPAARGALDEVLLAETR